jgi:hypothetical protein
MMPGVSAPGEAFGHSAARNRAEQHTAGTIGSDEELFPGDLHPLGSHPIFWLNSAASSGHRSDGISFAQG